MNHLDSALYRSEQIRVCEQQAMSLLRLDEDALMRAAGQEAFLFLLELYPKVTRIAVFCGAGNNAGDGYVLARLAHERGLTVLVYQCKPIDKLPRAARNAAMAAMAAGVECQLADEPLEPDAEILVDALLGIGLKGPVHGVIATAIQQINASDLPVISLDVPSGLHADSGYAPNLCVRATVTLSFIGRKAGLYTADGPDFCGTIYCRRLKLESCLTALTPAAFLLDETTLPATLAIRKKNSHKGNFGHVLIIGGGVGMPGAVCLAAMAALRAGAGMVTVATLPDHVSAIAAQVPEAMVWGVQGEEELAPLLDRATVCVIGPGLGETSWAKSLFGLAMTAPLPMLIDASALNLLALQPQMDDNWVLTPHPGEAAKLLGCSTEIIAQNRYQAVQEIQEQYGGVVVLKGAGTLIRTEKNTFVCTRGNPGMASAGMGDILSGIIAALCAQGMSLSEAATLGVWLHASCGDNLARTRGSIGFLASDLVRELPACLRELHRASC